MRHHRTRHRLKRSWSKRKALVHGLVMNLFRDEQIETTQAKAKATQALADKLITLGKTNSLHAKRQAFAVLQDRVVTVKLFEKIAPLFGSRNGGYTRVIKTHYRHGDNAPMAILELTEKLPVEVKPKEVKDSKDAVKKATKATKAAPQELEAPKHAPQKPKKETPKSEESQSAKEQAGKADKQEKDEKGSFVKNLKNFFKRKGQE